MVVRILAKKATQKIIKELRANGFTVKKTMVDMYKCIDDGKTIFVAMKGRHGYLCRFDPDYWSDLS